jgi:hypothetical protein
MLVVSGPVPSFTSPRVALVIFTETTEGLNENLALGGRPVQEPIMGDYPNVLVGAESTEDRALHDSTLGGVKVAPNGDQVNCWRGGSGCERGTKAQSTSSRLRQSLTPDWRRKLPTVK